MTFNFELVWGQMDEELRKANLTRNSRDCRRLRMEYGESGEEKVGLGPAGSQI